MAKKSNKSRIPKSASKAARRKVQDSPPAKNYLRGVFHYLNRELIESIVIAFVLAFLFRTFLAEAFVIPTGSMANTLVGRHKDVDCAKCGQRFRAGSSSEVDNGNGQSGGPIIAAQCPNCGYLADVRQGNADRNRHKSYSGDRILVGKFAYEPGIGEPQRWDVAVFKFPGRPTVNYIKRLVGLPSEDLRIKDGDLYVKPFGEQQYSIARKSHSKVRAMMQPVHNNNQQPTQLHEAGWPQRWTSDKTGTPWEAFDSNRSYKTIGPANDLAWLRYRHTLPGKFQWQQLVGNARDAFDPNEAHSYLVTDSNAYNSSLDRVYQENNDDPNFPLLPGLPPDYESEDENEYGMTLSGLGMNWVSDLVLDCTLRAKTPTGRTTLELVDSGRRLRCTIDLTTGQATLWIEGVQNFAPVAETNVQGSGTYAVSFANVDNQLYLWVDGQPIQFDRPTSYETLGDRVPTAADLTPAAIGASGGAELEVSDLKIYRDIYYISMTRGNPNGYADVNWQETVRDSNIEPRSRGDFFSNPDFWRDQTSENGAPHKNSDKFRHSRFREFTIDENKFFMLGDNSARSADGRLWSVPDRGERPDMGHTVDRKLLIGKALFIYWPHSFGEIPGLGIPFPMFPNFGDMKFVK